MATKILLRFDEPAGVQPSDSMEHLEDLRVDAGATAPAVLEGMWTGRGRRFSAQQATALVAVDRTGRDTLLQRDVTVQAILTYVPNGLEQVLIAGGLHDGSASENPDYGLRFRDAGPNIEVSWFHATPLGALRFAPPGVFQHAGDDRAFLFTATRRWETTNRVVVRYFVGPELIGELTWIDGDIGGGTTGHTSIGAFRSGGARGSHWNGVIDELLVADFELSPEEIHHTWRRLVEYQPAGVSMFVGLSPPGLPWFENPSNAFGRRVKVVGTALGMGIAAAEELRALWLPDAAPLDHISRWEELCGLTAKPRDSLDVRRARVISYLSREEGFSHSAIKTALSGVLELEPADIELIEFTNEVTDSFSMLSAERWLAEPGSEWSIAADRLRLTVPAGQSCAADPLHARHLRMAVDRGDDGPIFAALSIPAATLPPATGVGILLYNRATDDYLWFGLFNGDGILRVAWQRRVARTTSSMTFLNNVQAGPIWLRLHTPLEVGNTLGASGQFSAAWSVTGPSSGFATVALGNTGIIDTQWAGIAAIGGVLGNTLQADFDDWTVYAPNGTRAFCWYAFRDQTLPGTADIVGAQLLLSKLKPAHTHSGAIQSRSVLCDVTPAGLCDHGCLGGI